MSTETRNVIRWLIFFVFTAASMSNMKEVWGTWAGLVWLPAFAINTYSWIRLVIWLWNNADK